MSKIYTYEEAIAASTEYFNGDELAASVFVDKYALRNKDKELLELTPNDMHWRIAREIARIEIKKGFKNPLDVFEVFALLDRFRHVVPQGGPSYGIGNTEQFITLSNCYVVTPPADSYGGILDTDQQIVQISKRRGGCGTDISNLRPENAPTTNSSNSSTGPITFLKRYSHSIREVGQCIARGSLVLTCRGIIKIEDVNIGDRVLSNNQFVPVTDVIASGKKHIYKITTKAGYSITASKDHILQSSIGGKVFEQPLSDFEIGDNITLCFNNTDANIDIDYISLYDPEYKNTNNKPAQCVLPTILDEKLAYVLGYSYGNGYLDNNSLEVSCPNKYENIKTKIELFMQDIFSYTVKRRSGSGQVERLTIGNATITAFLRHNNLLKEKSAELIFPDKILQSPQSVQRAFIAGYFDADGYASGTKRGFVFASTSHKFLHVLQIVLSYLGILSKLHIEHRPDKNWKTLYSLCVVGSVSQNKFLSLFKLYSIKTQLKNAVSVRDNWSASYNTKNMSIGVLQRLQLQNCLVNDVVTQIEYIGEEDTYDLVLPYKHMFSCNGIYVHNSGRRGALMTCISIKHPDVLKFASIKRDLKEVTGSNLSIRLDDEFMQAVIKKKKFKLQWPVDSNNPKIIKEVDAHELWYQIIENAWAMGEPGLLFWDKILKESPGGCYHGFKEVATNPCAELPLPNFCSCRLLVVPVHNFVVHPFTEAARFNYEGFIHTVKMAQRIMDDIVDLELECIDRIIEKINKDPEDARLKATELWIWQQIKEKCQQGRRTGTGLTGLGDCLAMLGIKYGSEQSILQVNDIYRTFKLAAYESSVDMAEELGPFPIWNPELEKDNPFLLRIRDEKPELYEKMQKVGRRNIALLTSAPVGSLSILTQSTSGIEPLFEMSYMRRKKGNPSDTGFRSDFVDQNGDHWTEFKVFHPQVKKWMQITGETEDLTRSPWYGACAEDIDWRNRVKLQATAQRHIDHAISSTINLPESATVEDVAMIYEEAWKQGCKGITVYRKNSRTGVLVSIDKPKNQAIKRPRELPCDVHHITVRGKSYFVLIGIIDNQPYEVFAGRNGSLPKEIKKGRIVRKRKGFYKAFFDDSDVELCPITNMCEDYEEAITRLTSALLREKVDINLIVSQLEKVGQNTDMNSFAKSIARALKKYIPDGTKVGEKCECGAELIRENGCVVCKTCGFSKCL